MARTTTARARTTVRKTAARANARRPVVARRTLGATPHATVRYTVRAGRSAAVRLIDANRSLLLAGLGAAVRVTDLAHKGGTRALHELGRARNTLEKRATAYVEKGAATLKTRVEATAEQVDRRSVQATRALERRIARVAGDVRRSTGRIYGELVARGEVLNAQIVGAARKVERISR